MSLQEKFSTHKTTQKKHFNMVQDQGLFFPKRNSFEANDLKTHEDVKYLLETIEQLKQENEEIPILTQKITEHEILNQQLIEENKLILTEFEQFRKQEEFNFSKDKLLHDKSIEIQFLKKENIQLQEQFLFSDNQLKQVVYQFEQLKIRSQELLIQNQALQDIISQLQKTQQLDLEKGEKKISLQKQKQYESSLSNVRKQYTVEIQNLELKLHDLELNLKEMSNDKIVQSQKIQDLTNINIQLETKLEQSDYKIKMLGYLEMRVPEMEAQLNQKQLVQQDLINENNLLHGEVKQLRNQIQSQEVNWNIIYQQWQKERQEQGMQVQLLVENEIRINKQIQDQSNKDFELKKLREQVLNLEGENKSLLESKYSQNEAQNDINGIRQNYYQLERQIVELKQQLLNMEQQLRQQESQLQQCHYKIKVLNNQKNQLEAEMILKQKNIKVRIYRSFQCYFIQDLFSQFSKQR